MKVSRLVDFIHHIVLPILGVRQCVHRVRLWRRTATTKGQSLVSVMRLHEKWSLGGVFEERMSITPPAENMCTSVSFGTTCRLHSARPLRSELHRSKIMHRSPPLCASQTTNSASHLQASLPHVPFLHCPRRCRQTSPCKRWSCYRYRITLRFQHRLTVHRCLQGLGQLGLLPLEFLVLGTLWNSPRMIPGYHGAHRALGAGGLSSRSAECNWGRICIFSEGQ